MQRLQKRQGLLRQRYEVLDTGFHTLGRNAPLRVRKIDVAPARLTQLAGSDEQQWGKLQGDAGDRPPLEIVRGTQ